MTAIGGGEGRPVRRRVMLLRMRRLMLGLCRDGKGEIGSKQESAGGRVEVEEAGIESVEKEDGGGRRRNAGWTLISPEFLSAQIRRHHPEMTSRPIRRRRGLHPQPRDLHSTASVTVWPTGIGRAVWESPSPLGVVEAVVTGGVDGAEGAEDEDENGEENDEERSSRREGRRTELSRDPFSVLWSWQIIVMTVRLNAELLTFDATISSHTRAFIIDSVISLQAFLSATTK